MSRPPKGGSRDKLVTQDVIDDEVVREIRQEARSMPLAAVCVEGQMHQLVREHKGRVAERNFGKDIWMK